jgi:hypothetical protein
VYTLLFGGIEGSIVEQNVNLPWRLKVDLSNFGINYRGDVCLHKNPITHSILSQCNSLISSLFVDINQNDLRILTRTQ